MNKQLQAITNELLLLAPESRQAMINAIDTILSRAVIEVVDTHNTASVVFIFKAASGTYVLKAEHGEIDATNREITWYKEVKNLPSPAPALLYAHKGVVVSFIIIDYIENAVTLDDVMYSSEYSSTELLKYVDETLYKCRELFDRSIPSSASSDEIEASLITKFDARVERSQQHPYLRDLLSAKAVTINGKKHRTPVAYMDLIKNNSVLHTYLTPTKLGFIHGDLHFGNILVNEKGLYFIDPNSALRMPIEYDYGKLLHSTHGGYGQIMNGEYRLTSNGDNDYSFSTDIPQKQKQTFDHLRAIFTEQELARAIYTEALHFATMLPNHVAEPEETKALYLRDIEIFEELFGLVVIKTML